MSTRVWLGLFFLLFGFGFLMNEMNLIDFPMIISNWWPIIIIVVGFIQLTNKRYSSIAPGIFLILIGALFLLNQLLDINLMIYFWPLIFIFIGVFIIFSKAGREKAAHTSKSINTSAIFSGTEIRSQSKHFQGGSVTTIFGSAEIDLREAIIPDEGAVMDLTTVFGSIEIMVPPHVQVELTGLPIMGGWDDKTRRRSNEDDQRTVLKLNSLTVFGGLEVKN